MAGPGSLLKQQEFIKNSKTLVERKIIICDHWTAGALLDNACNNQEVHKY